MSQNFVKNPVEGSIAEGIEVTLQSGANSSIDMQLNSSNKEGSDNNSASQGYGSMDRGQGYYNSGMRGGMDHQTHQLSTSCLMNKIGLNNSQNRQRSKSVNVDWKNAPSLMPFLTESNQKMNSRSINGVDLKTQKKIKAAVSMARHFGLLSFGG